MAKNRTHKSLNPAKRAELPASAGAIEVVSIIAMTRPRYFSPAASFSGAACEQHLAQSKPVPHYSCLIPEGVFSICEENHERLRTEFGPPSARSPSACRSRSQCCRNRKRVSRTKTRPACKRGLAAKRCARDLPDQTDDRAPARRWRYHRCRPLAGLTKPRAATRTPSCWTREPLPAEFRRRGNPAPRPTNKAEFDTNSQQ